MTVRIALTCLMVGLALPLLADDKTALITMATYNIRYANTSDGLDVWPNRVDAVVDFASQNDIIGMQEVTAAQLGQLSKRLADFAWYGVGRDDGKSGGEHAVIFYRKARFEAVDQGTIWLSENPQKIGVAGWDAALPRTCTWMVLHDRNTNEKLWVANTHFDHRGAEARTQSGKLIAKFAAQQSGKLPVVVMGDFNCEPDSTPYQALAGTLRDARSISKSPPSGPASTWNGFQHIAEGRIIDHIFVGGPIEVLEIATHDPKTSAGRFASDHLPVQVKLHVSHGAAVPGE